MRKFTMSYIGSPRWRYLLVPFIMLSLIPALLVTFISLGTVRAVTAAIHAFEWSLYDR